MSTSLLQSEMWAAFRETQGWHAHRVGDIFVLERSLPLGKTFLYSPEVTATPEILLKLLPEVARIAKRRNSLFYRLELLIPDDEPLAERWTAALNYTHFRKAFESVQPEHRQIIPLTNSDDVFHQMKQKGRYNIRLAEKSGVTVHASTKKSLEHDVAIFYDLFKATAKRDKFTIRPKSYFETLCAMLYEHDAGILVIARYENTPVAAAIITLYDGVASYLYGASGNEHRNVMGPYAMHWAAIHWAIKKKASAYDLLAIRPRGTKPHPYDGITRFKQQFGGDEKHYLGSWDYAFDSLGYNLFKLAEKLRR